MQTRVYSFEVLVATICADSVLYEDPDSTFSYGLSCDSGNIPYLLGFFDAVGYYEYFEGSLGSSGLCILLDPEQSLYVLSLQFQLLSGVIPCRQR
jgi:hypothetical protein